MKKLIPLFILLLFSISISQATDYYIATNGNSANPGTLGSPFASFQQAINLAQPGDNIYVRGGTYAVATTITIGPANNGSSASPIKLWAYQNEKPILDFTTQTASGARGILLTGSYWHIKGLEIAYAVDNGIKVEGNNNTIELVVTHHCGDTGIQLGFGHDTPNPNGANCAYNLILNCDSYLNFDIAGKGGNADGFACKMHNGKGNVFKGCRAWDNSDDGWDLFETDWPVEILNCWTWYNGYKTSFDAWYLQKTGNTMSSFSGNGNGIKLGGNGAGGSSVGTHVVKNCISFDNNATGRSKKGFDLNSHAGGVIVHNCTAFRNGYNYMFETEATNGNVNEFKNNVSFEHKASMEYEFTTGAIQQNNSWNLPVTETAADFQDLTQVMAKAPRQSDGSLPNNAFARLVAGSDLIDKGVDVGLPFSGAAPDLGAIEFVSPTGIKILNNVQGLSLFPNPFTTSFTLKAEGEFTYTIYNVQGVIMGEGSGTNETLVEAPLATGVYTVLIKAGNANQVVRVNKIK